MCSPATHLASTIPSNLIRNVVSMRWFATLILLVTMMEVLHGHHSTHIEPQPVEVVRTIPTSRNLTNARLAWHSSPTAL